MKKAIFGACLTAVLAVELVGPASADILLQNSAEHRLQLDFHVSDTALKALLPTGWESNVARSGPAKGANIRMIFVNQIAINGVDNKPIGTNRFVYLAAPIKRSGTQTTGQMVVTGLSQNPIAGIGPMSALMPANDAEMQLQFKQPQSGPETVQEDWTFGAATGEHMELHVRYQPAPPIRSSSTVNVYAAGDATNYETWKIDQTLDITRNATVDVGKRLTDFSYKAGGGKLAKLFDGTEKVLSVDSQPWYNRAVSTP